MNPYFTVNDSEHFTFYRIPKLLFTDEIYQTVSTDAKMLYGLLLDRLSLSEKNDWKDEHGRVYQYFTIHQAQELLHFGHEKVCRLYAARKAGLTEVPVLIYTLDRDAAAIALVDSNLHREHILPSEKAYAYKLKMEALSHQGIACGQVGHKSRDDISDTDSGRQVQRYIRLTYLIPELLEKMDKEEIAFSVGVELSYLDEYSQRDVLEQCEINDCTPSYSQAWRMHKADREGLLTKDVIQFLMSEEKPNQRETVKIPTEKLREFAPDANPRQLEDFVLKACEHYRKYLIRQRGREER